MEEVLASLREQMLADDARARGKILGNLGDANDYGGYGSSGYSGRNGYNGGGYGGGYGGNGFGYGHGGNARGPYGPDSESEFDSQGRRRGHHYGGAPRDLVEASHAAEVQRYLARAGLTPEDLLAGAAGGAGAAAGGAREVTGVSPEDLARELAGDTVRSRRRGPGQDMWGNAIGRLNNGGYDPSLGDLYASTRPFAVPEQVAKRYGQSPMDEYEQQQLQRQRARGYGYGYGEGQLQQEVPGREPGQRGGGGELALPVDRTSR